MHCSAENYKRLEIIFVKNNTTKMNNSLSTILVILIIAIISGCTKTDIEGDTSESMVNELDINSDFQYYFLLNSATQEGVHNGSSILNEAGSEGSTTDSGSNKTWTSRFFNPSSNLNILKIGVGVQFFNSQTPSVEEFEQFFAPGPRVFIGNSNLEISLQDENGLEFTSNNGIQLPSAKFEIIETESQFSSFGFQYLKVNLSADSILLYSEDAQEDPLLFRDASIISIFSFQE